MKYLRLHIKAVMQYYPAVNCLSTSPSGTYYRTEKVPTCNALVGMIGAMLGYERNGREITELPNRLKFKYQTVKAGSVFADFQTIKPKNGETFTAVNGGTRSGGLIKTVEYLQDAEFYVYVGGEESFLNNIYERALNPVYVPYVGKKCCFLSENIVDEQFKLIDEEELVNVYDCP